MAEKEGFEPSIEFPLYTLSRGAPSATRPFLREFDFDLQDEYLEIFKQNRRLGAAVLRWLRIPLIGSQVKPKMQLN